ncbi:hypothetical protein FIBSPDRAFT_906278, partial [Athelia psychrophila]
IIVAQVVIDQTVTDVLKTMQYVYSFVDAIAAVSSKNQLLRKIIQQILIQTAECARLIQEYLGHGFAGRLLRETIGASAPADFAAMTQSLITLRGQFDTGVAAQAAMMMVPRIQMDVATLVQHQMLSRLGPFRVPLAGRSRCLPGTRRDAIGEINESTSRPSIGDNSNSLEGRKIYINGLLVISLHTSPDVASQSIVDGLDGLSHLVRITDEAVKVHSNVNLPLDVPPSAAQTSPAMAAQFTVNVLDKLSHFMRITDEVSTVHPYAKVAWDVLSTVHK